jgi:hypothetical protein
MNKNGMECSSFIKRLSTHSSASTHIRTLSIMGMVSGSLLLSACNSLKDQSSPQSRYLYDAPAQAYTIDLGAQNFRGDVRLRESCTPEGSSLDIYDNTGRFFRIDAVNLINNPNIILPEFADDTTTRDLIFRYYMEKVNPQGRILLQRDVNSRMGPALYAVTESQIAVKDDSNKTRYLGYLITRRGNFGYIVQHEQKFYRSDRMLEILGLIGSEIQIPGRLPTNQKQQDTPLYIDLQNSTAAQTAEWKRMAQCGDPSGYKISKADLKAMKKEEAEAEKPVDYRLDEAERNNPIKSMWSKIYDKIMFWKN